MESVAKPAQHDEIGSELVRDWIPEGDVKATIVLIHGIAEHSGRYERTGDLLSDAGFRVRSFDLIGHGASGGERVDIDKWSRFHDQIERHVSWARALEKPVVLMGHSMGGNLALGYVIDGRPAPDLIVVSAPAIRGFGAPWQRAVAPLAAAIAPTLSLPQNLKGEHLSRDPEVAEKYFADPLVHTSATTRFGAAFFSSGNDIAEAIDLIETPTLVLHGGADRIVAPQSTAPLGELAGFERRLYPKLRHEILNEPEGPEVVADIIAWLEEHL